MGKSSHPMEHLAWRSTTALASGVLPSDCLVASTGAKHSAAEGFAHRNLGRWQVTQALDELERLEQQP